MATVAVLPARRRRHHLGARRPAQAVATRPGTSSTSTPTWRSRWPSATSSRPAPTSSTTRRPAGSGRRCTSRSPRCCSGTGSSPRSRAAFRHRLRVLEVAPRERRRRLGLHQRPASGRAARRAGPVLPLAVPHPRPVVGGESRTRCRRAPQRGPAADHRQDRRRAQRGPARRCSPGTRVLAEGPYGVVHRRRRRRQRKVLLLAGGVGHHAAARAVRVAARAARRRHPDLPGQHRRRPRAARASSTRSPDARGAQVHYLLGPPKRGSRDHLSAERLRQARARPARARRLPLRPGADDGRRRGRAASAPASRAGTSTTSHSPSEEVETMKRVILTIAGTVVGLVALLELQVARPHGRRRRSGLPSAALPGSIVERSISRRRPPPREPTIDRLPRRTRPRSAAATSRRSPTPAGDHHPVRHRAGEDHGRRAPRSPTSPSPSSPRSTAARSASTPTPIGHRRHGRWIARPSGRRRRCH